MFIFLFIYCFQLKKTWFCWEFWLALQWMLVRWHVVAPIVKRLVNVPVHHTLWIPSLYAEKPSNSSMGTSTISSISICLTRTLLVVHLTGQHAFFCTAQLPVMLEMGIVHSALNRIIISHWRIYRHFKWHIALSPYWSVNQSYYDLLLFLSVSLVNSS